MKFSIIALFWLLVISGTATRSMAQEKQPVVLSSIKQTGSTIRITLSSPTAFYAGGNRYVLHIANKLLYRLEQMETSDISTLSFLATPVEFDATSDNSEVYLTYGFEEVPESELQSLADRTRLCWYLGKWDKNKLDK